MIKDQKGRGGGIVLRKATKADMPSILEKASEWALDIADAQPNQFIVAVDAGNGIMGFGRIKKYKTCHELGTVGIEPKFREKGIGKQIVEHLIRIFPVKAVWIATDKIEYFKRFGFKEVTTGPKELRKKIETVHCCKVRTGVAIMKLEK